MEAELKKLYLAVDKYNRHLAKAEVIKYVIQSVRPYLLLIVGLASFAAGWLMM